MGICLFMRDTLRNGWRAFTNVWRSWRRRRLGYVLLPLTGEYPERSERRPLPFPLSLLPGFPPPPSLEALREQLELLAADPRVPGVVLRCSGLAADPTTIQSLRQALRRFRESGKRVVVWLPEAGTWTYYLAAAADEVLIPESGQVSVMGLRVEAVFLKDVLEAIGVQAEFEALAEYKVTPDTFRRSTMSQAHREMVEAILDDYFAALVEDIASGRGLDQARVQELIDAMPMTGREAQEAGLVDGLVYEDGLPQYLGHSEEPAALMPWDEARRWLRRPLQRRAGPVIGVVSLPGTIVSGRGRRSPFPVPWPLRIIAEQSGAESIVQALRRAGEERRVAAVVFHVDSPGGSALAADLIWREVTRLRARKPVVVYMGGRAASGGYYAAAGASHIVAQPATLTGSIGVFAGKFVTAGLWERLGVHREMLQRGAAASLFADLAPFTPQERERLRRLIGETYARFKARVAEGRGMAPERVEDIARGRVWTGRQAQELGLVDELGDFHVAVERARELAGLDPRREVRVVSITPPRRMLLPRPRPSEEALWRAVLEGLHALGQERVWALLPWDLRVTG